MADSVCPPLGTGSVDMNALHDAARKNKDLEAALATATTRVEAPAEDAASAPATPADATPASTGPADDSPAASV